jgi:hypothetical protein
MHACRLHSMNPLRSHRLAVPLLLTMFTLNVIFAEETTADSNPPADDKNLRRIDGIFDTDLPKTEKKGRVRFIIHPHLGDFTRRSYVRVPLGIRWGVNDHVEFSATVEPYFEHGLKSGSSGNGIGDFEFGGKYAFRQWLKPDYDASVGLNVRVLVGAPPLDLTDGYNHYAPYFVISKKSQKTKGLTYFVNTTLDVMEKSSVAGTFRKDDPHSTSMIFGTGFVLDRYPYHYTLETGYQTTSLVGKDNKQFVYVRPGFAWDLPRKLTFNSHGRWLLGGSIKITEGPDGTRLDSGGKLRGEFSVTRWFRRDKKDVNSPPEKP